MALFGDATLDGGPTLVAVADTQAIEAVVSQPLPVVETYVVQEGDTLTAIADAYDTDLATLISLNEVFDADILAPGQPLKVIKAFHGLIYTVQSGDTLEGVARIHDIDAETILMANGLPLDAGLREGATLFLPGARPRERLLASRGGERSAPPAVTETAEEESVAAAAPDPEPVSAPAPVGDGWMWPIFGGLITSEFGWRSDMHDNHEGIDIAVPAGTPAVAARAGVVEMARWDGGYGFCVIIDHGDGTKSRYAHATSLLVSEGQWVAQGQAVIAVGSTGNSTGSHLHFEIIVDGEPQNPYWYLP